MTIKMLVLAVWAAFHPAAPHMKDADTIASAIETAVSTDPEAPVFGSREEDAAVMAYYAVRESWLQAHAVGDGGRSFGAWQQRAAAGRADVTTQAKAWLALLHEGARVCPANAAAPLSGGCMVARTLADKRVARARKLLDQARRALEEPELAATGS